MSRGFILVEVSITYVILALAICALVPVFILAIRASKGTEQIAVATQLSAELLEEVKLRRWDRLTPSNKYRIAKGSAIGRDAGESAADKRTFDDVDDFDGWSEATPKDPVMEPLPAFSAYSRTVAVRYVDENLAASTTPTDYKQVTACTRSAKLKPLCMDTIVTNR